MCREPGKQGEPKSLRAAFLYPVPNQRIAGLRLNDSRGRGRLHESSKRYATQSSGD